MLVRLSQQSRYFSTFESTCDRTEYGLSGPRRRLHLHLVQFPSRVPCTLTFYLRNNGLSTITTWTSRHRATVCRFKLAKQCTRNGQLGGSPCLVTQPGNCLVGEGSSGLDVYAPRTEYGLMLDNTASHGSDEICRTTGIYSLHIHLDLVSSLMAFRILAGRSGLDSTDTLFLSHNVHSPPYIAGSHHIFHSPCADGA